MKSHHGERKKTTTTFGAARSLEIQSALRMVEVNGQEASASDLPEAILHHRRSVPLLKALVLDAVHITPRFAEEDVCF